MVFAPFHVMKLDQLRRELWNDAPPESRLFVKNSRWVLLKDRENLSDKPNPQPRSEMGAATASVTGSIVVSSLMLP